MIRIGTSGWTYGHWRGVFYPDDLPQNRWFGYYAEFFDTVELNATFYRLFPEKTFEGWRKKAPEGFQFAVKLWRWITHRRKLSGVAQDVKTFCSRAEKLGDKLGPILVQFPPGMKWSPELVKNFADLLSQHFLWVFEIRNRGWLNEEFFDLLRKRDIALAFSDYPGLDMTPEQVFGPLIYLRFHGAEQLYAGSYPDDQLQAWAGRIRSWQQAGEDVWVYFNNDFGGHAVRNALDLKKLCGIISARH